MPGRPLFAEVGRLQHPPKKSRKRLKGAMLLSALLIAGVWAPAWAGETEGRTKPTLQISPVRYGPIESILEARWVGPEKIQMHSVRDASSPLGSHRLEFPPEEFSFMLVEYSSPIRVVKNDMLFRFEAPGVGKALVSCEFIF